MGRWEEMDMTRRDSVVGKGRKEKRRRGETDKGD